MHKLIILCLLGLSLVALAGCSNGSDSSLSASDLEKAQAIAVVDPDGNILQTITGQDNMEAFVNLLDIDHWDLEDVPESANIVGSFGFSQEKTIRLGEKSDGKLYDVAKLTLYDSHHIRIKVVHFIVADFAVPDKAYDALTKYFV